MDGWQKFAGIVEEFALAIEQSSSERWWEESPSLQNILCCPKKVLAKCGVEVDYRYPIWELKASKLMVNADSIWDANLVLETSNRIADTRSINSVAEMIKGCEVVDEGYGLTPKDKQAAIQTLGLRTGQEFAFEGKFWLFYPRTTSNSVKTKKMALQNLRSWKRWAESQHEEIRRHPRKAKKGKANRRGVGGRPANYTAATAAACVKICDEFKLENDRKRCSDDDIGNFMLGRIEEVPEEVTSKIEDLSDVDSIELGKLIREASKSFKNT